MRRSRMPVSAEALFAWHARPGALERLIPPWSGIRIIEHGGGMEVGARTVLSMPFGPFRFRWMADHVDYEPNRLFRDVQARGPFAKWDHLHLFEPVGARLSDLEDRITYALPFGHPGRWLAGRSVRRELERTFVFRHRTTCDDLAVHAIRSRRALRIGVTAPRSLIGAALCPFLTTGGHDVLPIDLNAVEDGARGRGEGRNLDGFETLDALIHLDASALCGAGGEELPSRAAGEKLVRLQRLVRSLAGGRGRPRVFVNVSDTSVYGPRGYERLPDEADFGSGRTAEFFRAWERVAEEAGAAGIRVVNARVGVILSAAGGVLPAMLRALRAGFYPVPGDGRQFVSWIGLDDVIGVLLHAVSGGELTGAVNVVAPVAATGRELAAELLDITRHFARRPKVSARAAGRVFGRAVAARLASSTRTVPNAVLRAGYEFRDLTLESALRHTLGA